MRCDTPKRLPQRPWACEPLMTFGWRVDYIRTHDAVAYPYNAPGHDDERWMEWRNGSALLVLWADFRNARRRASPRTMVARQRACAQGRCENIRFLARNFSIGIFVQKNCIDIRAAYTFRKCLQRCCRCRGGCIQGRREEFLPSCVVGVDFDERRARTRL